MTMDHAAAHEDLADLALEPHRLRRLDLDASPRSISLRAHLAECGDCRAELEAWRRVYAGLDEATRAAAAPLRSLEPSEPVAPSPALRSRTLAAIAGTPQAAGREDRGRATPRPDAGRPRAAILALRPRLPSGLLGGVWRAGWVAATAALVLALGLGGLVVQRTGEADQARREAAELAASAGMLDRILAEPTHWVVPLRTADGAAGGTVAWSTSEVVVLTTALTPAADGATYRCWVEDAGTRTPVGTMSFSGSVGYWAGSTASWPALQKGARFGVTAVASGASGGSAVLVADL
ncbi:MAG TPA: anti-sigma factor [Candidatus Dormibacteraeota bacterium]|nr:anti-sigma factor [Candidatus Dormibacteraeota bacterium]